MHRFAASLAFLILAFVSASNASAHAGRMLATEAIPPAAAAHAFPRGAGMPLIAEWNVAASGIAACSDTEPVRVTPAQYGTYETVTRGGRNGLFYVRWTIALDPQGIASVEAQSTDPGAKSGPTLATMSRWGYCARSRMGSDGSIRLTVKKTDSNILTPYMQSSTNFIVSADAAGNPRLSMSDEGFAFIILFPWAPAGSVSWNLIDAPLTRIAR